MRGAGTDVIKVRGVEKLHGCTYSIIDVYKRQMQSLSGTTPAAPSVLNTVCRASAGVLFSCERWHRAKRCLLYTSP